MTDLNGPGTGKTYVAVKTLKEAAGSQERKDLHQELKVLKNLGKHPNVLSLLACCTEKGKLFKLLILYREDILVVHMWEMMHFGNKLEKKWNSIS